VKVFYRTQTQAELIGTLRAKAATLAAQLPIERCVLFGSWAIDRATAFSDIDVLVTYRGPERADAYELARATLHVRGLELHIMTTDAAAERAAVLDRMTERGVDLLAED
jgi:predicted nucleotidyltransferase